MQNIDVRFNATSNFGRVGAELAALEARAERLGTTLQGSAYQQTPKALDPLAWRAATQAVHEASRTYRDTASSSGLLTTQQIRATSETEKYTKSLQKQKLAFSDMRKNSGIMKEVYNEQLKYQRMTAQYWGTDSAGRAITDIAIPKNVPRDLDTAGQRAYFMGEQFRSAGTQAINMGKNMQWAGRQLTVGFTYPLAMVGAASATMAYKVDEALTGVTKVYDVSAEAMKNEAVRTKELNDVRVKSMDLAKKAAQDYGMSINDTLEIEQRLAATGLSGKNLYDSTKEVSRIATLGDIEVGQATDMTVSLQTAFKSTIKTTKDLSDTFNYMNAVENATSLSLQDIAEATPRAASGLAGLGVNAKEMTVMLVAMREAGVDAAEGANALKSATTRILNPVNKAKEYYDQYGISLESLSKQSGGNLIEFLKLLSVEQQKITGTTIKETNRLRQKGVANLFGTYQFNRLNAALVGVGDAFTGMGDSSSQAAKAAELLNADMKELGKTADDEIGQRMSSASGKFKKAWQGLRAEMVEFGIVFLEVGTYVVDKLSAIAGAFNGMPDWAKKAAFLTAVVAGLAGPIVMIGGLVANLSGQFVSGFGRMLTMYGKVNGAQSLMTKEQMAAKLTAEAQNKALMQTTQSVGTLASEMAVLTRAYQMAATQAERFSVKNSAAGTSAVAATGATAAQAKAQTWTPAAPTQSFLGMPAGTSSSMMVNPAKGTAKEYEKAAAKAKHLSMVERNRQHIQLTTSMAAQAQAESSKTISKHTAGAAASGAVFAASLATMTLSSSAVANDIAKWAMIGSVVVPAVTSAAGAMGGFLSNAKQAMATNIANLNTIRASAGAGGLGALSGAMATAKAGAVGFGSALNAAMGPVGWTVLGLTAVAGTFMAIKSHQDRIKKKQEELVKKELEANKALMNSTDSIATNLGKAAGHYKQIVNAGGVGLEGSDAEKNNVLKSYEYYKNDDEGKKQTAALQSDGKMLETDALMSKIKTKFIDLQVIGSNTAKQSRAEIQGMLLAAGMSAVEAKKKAQEVFEEYGNISKIDWSKPIKDQVDGLTVLAGEAFKIEGQWLNAGGASTWVSSFEIDEGKKKLLYQQAEKSAQIFNQALAAAANPAEAKQIIDQYMSAATSMWDQGFDNIMASAQNSDGGDKVKALFKKYGVDSGKAFADAMKKEDFKEAYDKLAVSPSVANGLGDTLSASGQFAREYEKAFIIPLAKSSWSLGDTVTTATGALKDFHSAGIGLNVDEATQALLSESTVYKDYADSLEKVNMLKYGMPSDAMAGMTVPPKALPVTKQLLDAQGDLDKKAKAATRSINELNQQFGFKQGKNATESLNNLLNQTKAEAGDVKDGVKAVDASLASLPKNTKIHISLVESTSVLRDAMANVQSRMADSASAKFDSGWDSRIDGLQYQHEAQSEALERSQEAAQNAFESRWEKRKESVEKAYDKRIERINKTIESEEKADEKRGKLFDKEKKRLEQLAKLENLNIDFNQAVSEGRLDDAAKIVNDSNTASNSDQMDAEQAAAEEKTAKRKENLEKKTASLEKQREKAMKRLEKMEEAQKASLDRMQDARQKALQRTQEAQMKSLEKQRDYEKAMLDQRLELFKSYTARNKGDLERWMKTVGLSYDTFGTDVKAKGDGWSKHFRTELQAQIRLAGTKISSDNMWENMGKEQAKAVLKGFGFTDMKQFRHFVKTGQMKDSSEKLGDKPANPTIRHEGGFIGSGGKNSRKGVAPTYKGLHRSEEMVLGQKGEFVVNRGAASKHGEVLNAINSGASLDGIMDGIMGGAGGDSSYLGPAAIAAAVGSKMFTAGVSAGLGRANEKGKKKAAANSMSLSGASFGGNAGSYGGRSFGPAQMANAATIASVGASMGMSSRDIMIGIMTAIAESGLVNVNYGDRDSLGLFQQRPSMGWGTVAQVTDPKYASNKFFSVLKGHTERGAESPWLAAQHVQRSAFSDGSNYAVWWAAAQQIFNKGLKKNGNGYAPGGGTSGYVAGSGGKHVPINAPTSRRLHGGNSAGNPPAYDFSTPTGTPVYAVADGVITSSRDIAGPLATDTYKGDGPYGSFGRVVTMNAGGNTILYAHLSRRSVTAGQQVKGGSVIGYSGNTGNSSGDHLHFGATNGPGAWLRTGGTVRYDNTPATLHKGETVLTSSLTRQFKNNVASGAGSEYTVTIDMRGSVISNDLDVEKAVSRALDKRENKVGRKRVVR